MAYHGLGIDGNFRGIESGIAKWLDVSLSVNNLTVNNLTVVSGANLPAFNTLVVNPTGISNLATVTSGVWNASVITEIYGGTGENSYNPGDILFSDATNNLTVLPSGAEGESLQIIGGALAWGP